MRVDLELCVYMYVKVCSSYPQEVIVPFSVSDEDIRVVAGYRHLQRFPVLCFHHGKTQAVLLRGGQPLCGPLHKRCKEDVALLNACLPSLSKGKVLDIRQPSTAQQHMSKGVAHSAASVAVLYTAVLLPPPGGGVELPSHYPQWKVEYGKLEPPPSLLASLNKLIEGAFLLLSLCFIFDCVCVISTAAAFSLYRCKCGQQFQLVWPCRV